MALTYGQPPDGIPVQTKFRYLLGMFHPDIVKNSPLVNAKKHLVPVNGGLQPIQPCHLLFAPFQPAVSPCNGMLHIATVRHAGRALVKSHGNGRSQIRLDLHAFLRPHENLFSVNMGMEIHPLLLDFPQARQGKDLEPAGICQDGLVPDHKFVEPAQFLYYLVPRADVEMVGVGKLYLCLNLLQILCGHGAFDGCRCAYVHKNRGLDHPVHRMEFAALGTAFLF